MGVSNTTPSSNLISPCKLVTIKPKRTFRYTVFHDPVGRSNSQKNHNKKKKKKHNHTVREGSCMLRKSCSHAIFCSIHESRSWPTMANSQLLFRVSNSSLRKPPLYTEAPVPGSKRTRSLPLTCTHACLPREFPTLVYCKLQIDYLGSPLQGGHGVVDFATGVLPCQLIDGPPFYSTTP